jgi:uncharacterized iron-regulated membrane protein
MKRIRQIHLYLGALFAPLLIFFAFTGALQTFNLHESPRGSAYSPPAWLVKISEIHKNQRASREQGARPSVPLKWFVLVMACGLIATSALGIYMAFKYNRDQRVVRGLVILGIVIPVVLLYL